MHKDPTPGWHRPLDVEVDLRYRNLRPFPTRARRIWATGMALKTSGTNLPAGTRVELQVQADGHVYNVPAVVEESSRDSVIVRFDEPRYDLWRHTAAPQSLGLRPSHLPQPALT